METALVFLNYKIKKNSCVKLMCRLPLHLLPVSLRGAECLSGCP